MKCPNCELLNPNTATTCDCGYNFQSDKMATTSPIPIPKWTLPFASGHSRAQWVVLALRAVRVLDVVSLISGYLQLSLLSRIVAGASVSPADTAANDLRQGLIAMLQGFLLIVTPVFFLVWFHRAYRNLSSLGNHELKFSPGWAVGYFFVPVLGFISAGLKNGSFATGRKERGLQGRGVEAN